MRPNVFIIERVVQSGKRLQRFTLSHKTARKQSELCFLCAFEERTFGERTLGEEGTGRR